jgi:hypothetical protein
VDAAPHVGEFVSPEFERKQSQAPETPPEKLTTPPGTNVVGLADTVTLEEWTDKTVLITAVLAVSPALLQCMKLMRTRDVSAHVSSMGEVSQSGFAAVQAFEDC